LADLNREGQNQRDDASLKKRTTCQEKAHDQKQHQRPQNIATVFTDERWQMRSVSTRRQTD
jgi:hypothetical protein